MASPNPSPPPSPASLPFAHSTGAASDRARDAAFIPAESTGFWYDPPRSRPPPEPPPAASSAQKSTSAVSSPALALAEPLPLRPQRGVQCRPFAPSAANTVAGFTASLKLPSPPSSEPSPAIPSACSPPVLVSRPSTVDTPLPLPPSRPYKRFAPSPPYKVPPGGWRGHVPNPYGYNGGHYGSMHSPCNTWGPRLHWRSCVSVS